MEENLKQRGNPKGLTTAQVAANVNRLRKARDLDLKGLSAKLRAIGWPVSVAALSRLENGDRRVDVDDLMALSAALDASPLDLLFPTQQVEAGMGTGLPEYVTVNDLKSWGAGKTSLELEALRDHWRVVAAVREVEVEETKRWRETISEPESRARAIARVQEAEELVREAEERASALSALIREKAR